MGEVAHLINHGLSQWGGEVTTAKVAGVEELSLPVGLLPIVGG